VLSEVLVISAADVLCGLISGPAKAAGLANRRAAAYFMSGHLDAANVQL